VLERQGAAFAAGRPLDEEIEYVRRDGSRFWGRLQATPVHWDAPAGEALWIVEDVTAARQLRLQPTWTAKHDVLTELANRREFERRLAEHVGSRRHEPVSVLWVDVDRFTEVVHGMGTEVADHFLYGLGQMLITKVPPALGPAPHAREGQPGRGAAPSHAGNRGRGAGRGLAGLCRGQGGGRRLRACVRLQRRLRGAGRLMTA